MMGGNFRNPKCGEMASPIQYGVEEVDDAALWAIVDSAAASHSATKARKQQQQQLTVNHHRSPIVSSSRIIQYQPKSDSVSRGFTEGEVVQQPWNRPQKMARRCGSEMSESSPLPLVQQRSPEPYLSPQIGKSDCSNNSPKKQESMIHSLSGRFPSVSLFKDYQNAAMAILEKTDFTMISGNPFIKKSGWRKISFYFNLSYEIKDKTIEFDDNRNVQRAEFVVRAHMQGGRFSDGWGSCERREKRFLKPNHDIPSTAETRAKNKACQDLLGIGEYRPGAGHLQRQN